MKRQICKQCILDDRIPGIFFNSSGVCCFCEQFKQGEKNKPTVKKSQREKAFQDLIRKASRKGTYDCLCLYSGGKDSSYMLYHLVKKQKLKVLAFTLDNGFLPEETYKNINKVVTHLNVDSIVFKPSLKIIQSLLKISFFEYQKNEKTKKMAFHLGHVCWPCFVLILTYAFKCAVQNDIPSIVIGATPGQIKRDKFKLTLPYVNASQIYDIMLSSMLKILREKDHENYLDLIAPYSSTQIKRFNLKMFHFYEFFKYQEDAIYKKIKGEFGWIKPKETDSCSTNCLLNSLGIYLHYKKYGLSPYAIPTARDVREGLITRNKAMKSVNKKPDAEVIKTVAKKLKLPLRSI